MDQELKSFLLEMKQELLERVAASEERLTARFVAIETRLGTLEERVGALEARLGALEGQFPEQISALEMRMREHTEKVETRLLDEFWKWARTSDARFRQIHTMWVGMDERMISIEDRLSELERRRTN